MRFRVHQSFQRAYMMHRLVDMCVCVRAIEWTDRHMLQSACITFQAWIKLIVQLAIVSFLRRFHENELMWTTALIYRTLQILRNTEEFPVFEQPPQKVLQKEEKKTKSLSCCVCVCVWMKRNEIREKKNPNFAEYKMRERKFPSTEIMRPSAIKCKIVRAAISFRWTWI